MRRIPEEVLNEAESDVNAIFGQNLRRLCAQAQSIAQVARDLNIGQVQMNRYMNGQSYPKPYVIKRFCAYFGVDARIIDTPLSQLESGYDKLGGDSFLSLMDHVTFGEDFASTDPVLGRGVYRMFRRPTHEDFQGYIVARLLRVEVHGERRILRGYNDLGMYPNFSKSEREFRGTILRDREDVKIFLFGRCPEPYVTVYTLRRLNPSIHGMILGYALFPYRKGATKVVLQRLNCNLSELVGLGRQSGLIDASSVPNEALRLLDIESLKT